jgi:adenylate kinase
VQVECLKLLVDEMHALRREFFNTPLSIHFRHPTIHIMLLFVEEKESVARQLKRGQETLAHNEEVRRTGVGRLREDRPTDHDEVARAAALPGVQGADLGRAPVTGGDLHYHFVNAQGPFEKVEQNILQELQYQSTLELDPHTVERLLGVPVASEIIVHCAPGTGEAAGQLRAEAQRALRQRSSNSSSGR